MKIPKDFDVVNKPAPAADKGTAMWDNPGIKPHEKAVPDTPGENATNDVTRREINKAQPFKGKGVSGYTSDS